MIVSEWMSEMLLFENLLPSVLAARDRFLKPGGIMIPSQGSIYLAPISDTQYLEKILGFWDTVPQSYGVRMSSLKAHTLRELRKDVQLTVKSPEIIVAPSYKIAELDLQTMAVSEALKVENSFDFICTRTETVHGFIGWFDVKMCENITFSTSPYAPESGYNHSVFYIDRPFPVDNGTKISGNLSIQVAKNNVFLDIKLGYKVGDQAGNMTGDQAGAQAEKQRGDQAGAQAGDQAGNMTGDQAGAQAEKQRGDRRMKSKSYVIGEQVFNYPIDDCYKY